MTIFLYHSGAFFGSKRYWMRLLSGAQIAAQALFACPIAKLRIRGSYDKDSLSQKRRI